jgi:tetratricopeptide (TPR) repeat protein
MTLLLAGRIALADELLAAIDALGTGGLWDPAVAAWVVIARGTRAMVGGDSPGAFLAMREAAAKFDEAGDTRSACAQRVNLGWLAGELGAYEDAEIELRAALASAEQLSLGHVAATANANLAVVLLRRADFVEARERIQLAANAFGKRDNQRFAAGTHRDMAMVLLRLGDPSGAEREARAAIALTTTMPPLEAYARATLSEILRARGDVTGAITEATRSNAALEELGGVDQGESYMRLEYVEALLSVGRLDDAREAASIAAKRLLARADRFSDEALRESFLQRVTENARTLALVRRLTPEPAPATP